MQGIHVPDVRYIIKSFTLFETLAQIFDLCINDIVDLLYSMDKELCCPTIMVQSCT